MMKARGLVNFFKAVSFVALSATATASFALSQSAVFALDAATHSGEVHRLAVVPGERQVVTAGFDKTIRVWDAASGSLLKRWAVPVEDDNDGRIKAIAVSPDGRRLAIGGHLIGFDGRLRTVLVLDLRSGELLARLTEFLTDVTALAWSPDGKLLAIGSSGPVGMQGTHAAAIELFDTAQWSSVYSDKDFTGHIHDLAFGRGNSLVAAIEDFKVWTPGAGWSTSGAFSGRSDGSMQSSKFFIRTYLCGLAPCELHQQLDVKQRDLVRIYPQASGETLFVGGEFLFDASSLVEKPHRLEFSLGAGSDVLGVQVAVGTGDVFAISGAKHSQSSVIHRWRSMSVAYAEQKRVPDAGIRDFRVLADGRLVYVTQDGVLAAYDRDLNLLWRVARPATCADGDTKPVRVSPDGVWVTLPRCDGEEPVAFNLTDQRFSAWKSLRKEWIDPRTENSKISLSGWKRGEAPMVNRRSLPLSAGERSTTVAVHPSDESFVFGSTHGRVRRVLANGSSTWTRTFPSEVIALNQIEQKRWVIVVTADGFLRVLREADGETLVSYYVEPSRRKWIAVSREGYYEAGIGSEDLAGWIVNRDDLHLADFFPLSRFRADYLLPGFAVAALVAGDQDAALKAMLRERQLAAAGGRRATDEEALAASRAAELQLEAVRKAEAERLLAEQQAEAARLAQEERARVEREVEARIAEAARLAEQGRQEDEARKAEEARLAEEARQAEAARRAEAKRLAELQRIEDERQQQLAAAKAELTRLKAVAATVSGEVLVEASTPALDKLPPVVDILSPGFEVATAEPRLKVRYRIRTPEDAPVIRVSGRVVAQNQSTRGLIPMAAEGETQELELDLPAEDAEIHLVGENRWGASVPATIKVRWQGSAPKAQTPKGDLHIIAVGVSEYDQPDYRLGLAAKDAQDFVATLRKQEGGLYGKIRLRLLTDREADKKSVEEAILSLRSVVQPKDTTMVFIAGHGVNDVGGEYVYLPRDARLEQLNQTGISFRLVRDTLARLPGRTVIFVDTCHAGNVIGQLRKGQSKDFTGAINELASLENNIVVFASSTGMQVSFEDQSWGNGAFTKALVEGLEGEADMKKRGRVTYKQLDAYVSDRVDELTQGRQTPVTPVLKGVPDFILAEVRRSATK